MATLGKVYGLQDSHIYLKKHYTLDPFVWGGRCMRLEDISEALGGLSITTRQNPRGGVERDSVRQDVPGETTTTIAMKAIQWDRTKSDLATCFWDVDKRSHCKGMDRDSPFKWEEIRRICQAKVTDRTDTGSTWEGDEDAMVTLAITALYAEDIYRVTAEEGVFGTAP